MPAIPPTSGPILLDYAPAPPRWRKRARYILLASILLATGFCAWRWGPYAWHRSQLLYWQRQCLNFSASPDTVVYEEEPAAAALLLQRSGYSPYVLKRRASSNSHPILVQAAAFHPRCLRTLGTFITLPMWPLCASGPGGSGSGSAGAIIFLHERISSAGHRRLVCVNYAPDTDTFTPGFIQAYNYEACVISPATWKRPITCAPGSYTVNVKSSWPPRPPLMRVYAGQVDPADPAHFTIRYQMWGQEDMLDGRLQDDDQVTLTPRHPPQWPRQ